MAEKQIGWNLIQISSGKVIQSWGEQYFALAELPNEVRLPDENNSIVHCPRPGAVLAEDYKLVPRMRAALEEDYSHAIQTLIDTTAFTRGYSNGVALLSYLNCGIPAWEAEATVFNRWRSAVWAQAFAVLQQVKDGTIAPPTIEAFLLNLPAIVWPNA